jgi:peptidoglycan/xylan/chitin deacetylase (PgdA/CDA1 family)
MLLILLYHRTGEGPYANPVPVLREHFDYIRRHSHVVLPGEPLEPRRLNVCLSFDDAYADFYAEVFPMLQGLGLKALLAVPTGFIIDQTSRPMEERISVSVDEAMQGDVFKTKAPFCTWEELRTMTASGHVEVASHSHAHLNLGLAGANVEFEAGHSKAVLERELGRPVRAFVYPYGKVNAQAHTIVRRHYAYALRIGSASNWDWSPRRQPLARVIGDRKPDIQQLIGWASRMGYTAKWALNSLRATLGKW